MCCYATGGIRVVIVVVVIADWDDDIAAGIADSGHISSSRSSSSRCDFTGCYGRTQIMVRLVFLLAAAD